MANIKHHEGQRTPALRSLFSDFFNDSERFFDNDFLPSRMFPTRLMSNLPATNIRETEKEFHIEVAAPGLKKEDFHVDIENGMLIISSETKQESRQEENNYTRREYNFSSFQRSFQLPDNVDEDAIQATYTDGVLKLSIPKREGQQKPPRKQIQIR